MCSDCVLMQSGSVLIICRKVQLNQAHSRTHPGQSVDSLGLLLATTNGYLSDSKQQFYNPSVGGESWLYCLEAN
jgi:hypothetical protein